MEITEWRVYYKDSIIKSHLDCEWDDLPEEGVLAVVLKFGELRHTLIGADLYWKTRLSYGMIYDGSCCPKGQVSWHIRGGKIIKSDLVPPGVKLLKGILVSDKEWSQIERSFK